MITGLNHITLAVNDIKISLEFYVQVLGFKGHVVWDTGAYLSAGPLWLCLSSDPVCDKTDFTHYAFSIEKQNYNALCQRLKVEGAVEWKENKSEGKSFYFLDPDGHKLEIHVGDLSTRLNSLRTKPYSGMRWLSD